MKPMAWMTYLLAAVSLLTITPAGAQQLYRCGKVFQDRPCDGNQQINMPPATPTASASPQAAGPTRYPECARRGDDSLKIVWAKEAGRTEEMQLASASPDQRKLITDVYRKRGTSGEIRAAIEADCNAEKERTAQAAALIAAGNKMLEQDRPAPASSSGVSEQSIASQREALAANEASKARRCKSLSERLTSIRNEQRAGVSAGRMDDLTREFADIEKARRESAC